MLSQTYVNVNGQQGEVGTLNKKRTANQRRHWCDINNKGYDHSLNRQVLVILTSRKNLVYRFVKYIYEFKKSISAMCCLKVHNHSSILYS